MVFSFLNYIIMEKANTKICVIFQAVDQIVTVRETEACIIF
jgi:hypothetical protein